MFQDFGEHFDIVLYRADLTNLEYKYYEHLVKELFPGYFFAGVSLDRVDNKKVTIKLKK